MDRMMTDSGIQLIKAVGTINRNTQQIYDVIWDYAHKSEWDEMCIESLLVREFSPDFRVLYQRFTAPWPVSHRDFVFASRVSRIGNDILLTAKSIECESVPEKSGIVRGDVMTSGFYLEALADNLTRLTYLVNVNPKGSLPLWVVNKLGKQQCGVIQKMRAKLGDS